MTWTYEPSSGYNGFRCSECGHWTYDKGEMPECGHPNRPGLWPKRSFKFFAEVRKLELNKLFNKTILPANGFTLDYDIYTYEGADMIRAIVLKKDYYRLLYAVPRWNPDFGPMQQDKPCRIIIGMPCDFVPSLMAAIVDIGQKIEALHFSTYTAK